MTIASTIAGHLPPDWPSWAIDALVAIRPQWIANPARDFFSVVEISRAITPGILSALHAGVDRGDPAETSWRDRLESGTIDSEALAALFLSDSPSAVVRAARYARGLSRATASTPPPRTAT